VDLNVLSTKLLNTMTQEQADGFDAAGHADAKAENGAALKLDRTHLNEKGKVVFGKMVVEGLVAVVPELGVDVVVHVREEARRMNHVGEALPVFQGGRVQTDRRD
jgi:hypothetical protein